MKNAEWCRGMVSAWHIQGWLLFGPWQSQPGWKDMWRPCAGTVLKVATSELIWEDVKMGTSQSM